MIYKRFGRINKQVSAVGFGGMRFDMDRSMAENADLLKYAYDKGINYFDTAPMYCDGKSEEIFGLAMEQMRGERENYLVASKGFPNEFDTAEKARAAVEASLTKMKLEKLDFYYVWCIRRMDQYELAMKKGGQYEGLMKCKEEGLIDHILVSTHLPGPEIHRIIERGEFDGVLLGVNVLNFPYRWEGIQKAHEMDLGVIAMNPLAGGEISRFSESLSFLGDADETPVEAALRFCVSCPQISITLNGFTTREHIDTACKVAGNARPFSAEKIEQIRQEVACGMNELCTGCGYCLKSCPKNIPVASYLQYYNEKILLGKTDQEMIKELDFQHNWGLVADRQAEAGDCISCGQCETECTQHLKIMDRLKEIAGWEEEFRNSKG
ncbi:MAG: aldo/keto reductase [Phycisphaerae bacterium]|nr:aldo/keto reductase [Phycisphaerae bacterium]